MSEGKLIGIMPFTGENEFAESNFEGKIEGGSFSVREMQDGMIEIDFLATRIDNPTPALKPKGSLKIALYRGNARALAELLQRASASLPLFDERKDNAE